jgi:hypothetical protein
VPNSEVLISPGLVGWSAQEEKNKANSNEQKATKADCLTKEITLSR